MNQEQVLLLLGNIKHHRYAGITDFDVIGYALATGLLIRTPVGNFELSVKGEDLLNQKISWDDIIK